MMTPEQLYEDVINDFRKRLFRKQESISGFARYHGHDPRTFIRFLHRPCPHNGRLKLFLDLLTYYIEDNYERKKQN